MGDRLLAGTSPWYVLTKPTRSTYPCISLGSPNQIVLPAFGWARGGNVTTARWQVTLCDPTWHASSHSGKAFGKLLCPVTCWSVSDLPLFDQYKLGLFYTLFSIHIILEVLLTLVFCGMHNRARQLYKNISLLFLFPVTYGKLSTCVNAQRFLSCYG